jgi:predicted amidohydrolase
MMICFDWFFPEVARSLALDGAQIIAHPSNLVLPWCQRAMFARSVENHVFSITANRTGREARAGRELVFTGGSQVLGCNGEVLLAAAEKDKSLQVTAVDLAQANQKQMNPWNDILASRRPELYKL